MEGDLLQPQAMGGEQGAFAAEFLAGHGLHVFGKLHGGHDIQGMRVVWVIFRVIHIQLELYS